MTPKKVASSVALASLSKNEFQTCFLASPNKQVYTLSIFEIDAGECRLVLQPPGGRRANPIDLSASWEVSFRDGEGVYQATLSGLVHGQNTLVATLPRDLCFLARRKTIRLSPEGRSPTTVAFSYKGDHLSGFLVDLSPDGIGIQLPEADPNTCSLATDDHIHDTHFELRSCPIAFKSAKIANIAVTDDTLRIGIQFDNPGESELLALNTAINSWHRSQRASFPGCDG